MKKDLFWKTMAVIVVFWLFLWLWNSVNVITTAAYFPCKINKLTGKVLVIDRDTGKWIPLQDYY